MVRTMGVVLRDNMNEPGLGKDGLKLSEMFGKDGKKHENRNLQILSKILTGRRSTAVLSQLLIVIQWSPEATELDLCHLANGTQNQWFIGDCG